MNLNQQEMTQIFKILYIRLFYLTILSLLLLCICFRKLHSIFNLAILSGAKYFTKMLIANLFNRSRYDVIVLLLMCTLSVGQENTHFIGSFAFEDGSRQFYSNNALNYFVQSEEINYYS